MTVSLIVCSLPVLVTLILRLFGQDRRFKGSTTQGNSQSFGMSNSSGKRARITHLESTGNFASHPGYTSESIIAIGGSQGSHSALRRGDPSKVYGKDPLYPYKISEDSSRHDSKPAFSASFAYSSAEEEEAGRRGWAKGVQVAREKIASRSSENNQYIHRGRDVVHPPHNPR
jgi:hypothetical protein